MSILVREIGDENVKSLTVGGFKRNIPRNKKHISFDRSGYAYTKKYLERRNDILDSKTQEIFSKLKMLGLHIENVIRIRLKLLQPLFSNMFLFCYPPLVDGALGVR